MMAHETLWKTASHERRSDNRTTVRIRALALIVAAMTAAPAALAQANLEWIGGDGGWDTSAERWLDEGGAATNFANGDNAIFGSAGGPGFITITETGGITAGNVTFDTGGYVLGGTESLRVAGALALADGVSATIDASLGSDLSAFVGTGGTLSLSGGSAGAITSSGNGTLALNGGTYSGNVVVTNGSLAVGTASIVGSAAINGLLEIDVFSSGSVSSLFVTGDFDITNTALGLNLSGTLTDPAYVFATYGSLTGNRFSNLFGDPLPGNYYIDYAFDGNRIALVRAAAAVPAPAPLLLLACGLVVLGLRKGGRRAAA